MLPRPAALTGAAALVVLALVTPPRAAGVEPSLARANQRWGGAACATRYPIPIKKKVDREGASRSPLWMLPSTKGEKNLGLVYTVSSRAAIAGLLIGDEIPAGTQLVSLGWSLSRPEAEEGLGLSLRFRDAPAELRVGFIPAFGSADSLPLARLEQVERYARLEAFVCAAADERLTEPPATSPPVPHVPARPPAAVAPPPRAPAASFALQLHATAVRPPSVAAGGTIELVLTYELVGGGLDGPLEVVERREILRSERVLRTLESPLVRPAGVHSSAQSLRLPSTLEPGLYTLRGSVLAGGREAIATALFEVTAP